MTTAVDLGCKATKQNKQTKLSECKDLSIIIIIQFKFSYFLGCMDSYAW